MMAVRRSSLVAALGLSLLGVACGKSDPLYTTPFTAPTPPTNTVPLASLAGEYTLTIEFPAACAETPELSSPRQYQATLSGPRFLSFFGVSVLGVSIEGGGYSGRTGVGEVWPSAAGQGVLDYNNFDMDGCDGTPEPLSAGRTLMVCGNGAGTLSESVFDVRLDATAFIAEDGVRRSVCYGIHKFTFTRVVPQ